MFLVLGVCYLALQCIGWLLISEPNEEEAKMLEEESKPLGDAQETMLSPRPCGLTPKEAVRTPRFWEIWLVLMFISITNNFISSFYKVGETEAFNGSSSDSRSSRTISSSSPSARCLRSATASVAFSGE